MQDVRRMKNSPLTIEELQCIEEVVISVSADYLLFHVEFAFAYFPLIPTLMQGLKLFRHDWTSVWKFVVPYRDPALLQRQWRVANGVQPSYTKSDASKAKRRTYEAKRRKLKASMTDSQLGREQEVSVLLNSQEDLKIFECLFPFTVVLLSTIYISFVTG